MVLTFICCHADVDGGAAAVAAVVDAVARVWERAPHSAAVAVQLNCLSYTDGLLCSL